MSSEERLRHTPFLTVFDALTILKQFLRTSKHMSQGRTWSTKRLRLSWRSSPPNEDHRRSPPRNRRRPAMRYHPTRRLLPVPAAQPRLLVLGYGPALGGSWNPCTRPAARLSDGPRAPTPAPAARRRGRACPPAQTPAPPPGTSPGPPTRRHSTEARLRATPARPRTPKPSRWDDQRPLSWPS